MPSGSAFAISCTELVHSAISRADGACRMLKCVMPRSMQHAAPTAVRRCPGRRSRRTAGSGGTSALLCRPAACGRADPRPAGRRSATRPGRGRLCRSHDGSLSDRWLLGVSRRVDGVAGRSGARRSRDSVGYLTPLIFRPGARRLATTPAMTNRGCRRLRTRVAERDDEAGEHGGDDAADGSGDVQDAEVAGPLGPVRDDRGSSAPRRRRCRTRRQADQA